MRRLISALLFVLAASPAYAQYTGNIPTGTVLGNNQPTARPAQPTSLVSMLPPALVSGPVGVGTSTIDELAIWANTTGTLLKNGAGVSVVHTGDFTNTGNLVVGGAISGASLSTTGNGSIGGSLTVGSAISGASLSISGNSTIGGTLGVTGLLTAGTVNMGPATGTSLHLTLGSTIDGNSSFGGTLTVGGALSSATLSTTGNATVGGTLGVTGAATITGAASVGGTLDVFGAVTTIGNVNVNGDFQVAGAINTEALLVSGPTTLLGSTQVGTPPSSTSANFGIWGTLDVVGTTHLRDETHIGPTGSMYAVFDTLGSFNVSGTWNTLSALVMLEDISSYTRGLDTILALNPKAYKYKASVYGAAEAGRMRYGLVAEDVKSVLPEVVGEKVVNGEKTATLEPGLLIYPLINSVKELSERVKALESK